MAIVPTERDQTMTDTEDKLAHAKSQAFAQYVSIVELLDILKSARGDEDAREAMAKHFAEQAGYRVSAVSNDEGEDGFAWGRDRTDDEDTYETEVEAWVACCEANDLWPSEDDAREAITDDALSVEVRSDWHVPGDPDGQKASEFNILLCTGGPAVRIIGELNEYGEPDRAWMQCQDWGTSWTDIFGYGDLRFSQDTLLDFARNFYFGEG